MPILPTRSISVTRTPQSNPFVTVCGLLCLGASLVLLPAGVRTVHAEDGVEQLMSVDPVLLARQADATSVVPALPPTVEVKETLPGANRLEAQPGAVVLNTRGFNYGPPPAGLDPAAMKLDSATR